MKDMIKDIKQTLQDNDLPTSLTVLVLLFLGMGVVTLFTTMYLFML